jgi:FSR family fosmidomycin resistance protein-like MFS transporter
MLPSSKKIYSVLFSIAFAHLINDLMQSVIPATYPILKENFNFLPKSVNYSVYQLTASLLQPFIGFIHKKPNLTHWQLVWCLPFLIALLSVSTQF